MFDVPAWIEWSKESVLRRFPKDQREKVAGILNGQEIAVEHDIRYGKIICKFIPHPSDRIMLDDVHRREREGEPTVVYECGIATREAHEREVIKKMRKGASPEELIDDFIERQKVEGLTFYEPVADLSVPYLFSEELKKFLPKFIDYLVEKLDLSKVCLHLDEHQTLDFVPFEKAQQTSEMKRILVEDFLAKHSNEPEIRRALRSQSGGARKRKGFVWTDKDKIAFYQKVESLPKRGNASYWKYALDKLIEHEFDIETVTWLKSRPVLKDFPEQLFAEAVRTWRKYLESENWHAMREEDKPRAFEFRHALHTLGYPDGFLYSTLETHYYRGKRLSDKQK